MTTLLLIIISFMAGSLPFSVWVGRLALKKDIREYGDHNPGATNVLRAGGWQWGGLALLLDAFKGAIPVGIAQFGLGLSGWPLVAVAIAPVLGHAFSPLLHFKGGKAVAVTFGIWAGLTAWQVPILLGLALGVWALVQRVDAWAVVLAMLCLLVYLLATVPLSVLPWVWLGNFAIITWKHRADLNQPPRLRPWLGGLAIG